MSSSRARRASSANRTSLPTMSAVTRATRSTPGQGTRLSSRELKGLGMEVIGAGLTRRSTSRGGSGQTVASAASAESLLARSPSACDVDDHSDAHDYHLSGRRKRITSKLGNTVAEADIGGDGQQNSSIIRESTPMTKTPRSKKRGKAQLEDKENQEEEDDEPPTRAKRGVPKRKQIVKRGKASTEQVAEESNVEEDSDDDSRITPVLRQQKAGIKEKPLPKPRSSTKGKQRAQMEVENERSVDGMQDLASFVLKDADLSSFTQVSSAAAHAKEKGGQKHTAEDAGEDGDSDASFEVVGPWENVASEHSASGSEPRQVTKSNSAAQKSKRGSQIASKDDQSAIKKQKMTHSTQASAKTSGRMTALQLEVAQKNIELNLRREGLTKAVQSQICDQVMRTLNSQSEAQLRLETFDLNTIQVVFEIEEQVSNDLAADQPGTEGIGIPPAVPALREGMMQAKPAIAVHEFDDSPFARNSFRPHQRLDFSLMTKVAPKTTTRKIAPCSHAESSAQTEANLPANESFGVLSAPSSIIIRGSGSKHVEHNANHPPFYPWPPQLQHREGQVRGGGASSKENYTNEDENQRSSMQVSVRTRHDKKGRDRSERRKGNFKDKEERQVPR